MRRRPTSIRRTTGGSADRWADDVFPAARVCRSIVTRRRSIRREVDITVSVLRPWPKVYPRVDRRKATRRRRSTGLARPRVTHGIVELRSLAHHREERILIRGHAFGAAEQLLAHQSNHLEMTQRFGRDIEVHFANSLVRAREILHEVLGHCGEFARSTPELFERFLSEFGIDLSHFDGKKRFLAVREHIEVTTNLNDLEIAR